MRIDQDIQKLRKDYQQIKASVIKGNASTIKKEQIIQNKKLLLNQTNIAQKNQHYQNLQELIAYREKYDLMLNLMKQAKDKNYAKVKYQTQAQKIFNDHFSIINSQTKKIQPYIQQSQPLPNNSNAFSQMPKNLSSNIPIKNNSNIINPNNSNMNKTSSFNLNNNRNSQQNNSNILKSQDQQRSQINKDQLMSFFQKQQSKLQSKNQKYIGFKDVLEKPSLVNRSFKKKSQINQSQSIFNNKYGLQQLQQLRKEKLQLQKMINLKDQQQIKVQNQKNVVYQEKTLALKRINQLQNQIDYLNKDNQRLKNAEKSMKSSQNPNFSSNQNEDAQNNMYAPYIITPLSNDLRKISSKYTQGNFNNYPINESPSKFNEQQVKMVENDKSVSKSQHQFNQLLNDKADVKSMSNLSINRGDRFDSFIAANSQYSIASRKKGLGIHDTITCTRNKVAFFKNSLVLVKDEQNQIAFKKSQLNSSMDELRLIIYINNKTLYQQNVDIVYIDQRNSYIIQIKEKLKYIQPNSQGRQVLNIRLKSTKQMGSIIDYQVKIGQKAYDLWIPANFIKFDYKNENQTGLMESIIITPDKQFASYQAASSILPLANKQFGMYETYAYLNGKSKIHNGTFKLTWLQDRKLKIQGSAKWIDYLGFILSKFNQ